MLFSCYLVYNNDLMCKNGEMYVSHLFLHCVPQSSGCASRGAQAEGGEVAGHAQPLGQVDDQEIQ